jgi:hypothetical protein
VSYIALSISLRARGGFLLEWFTLHLVQHYGRHEITAAATQINFFSICQDEVLSAHKVHSCFAIPL